MRLSIAEGEKDYALVAVREHEEAHEESDPILEREGEHVTPHKDALRISWLYMTIMAINGGTVGAFGPALETLERTTGLSQVMPDPHVTGRGANIPKETANNA